MGSRNGRLERRFHALYVRVIQGAPCVWGFNGGLSKDVLLPTTTSTMNGWYYIMVVILLYWSSCSDLCLRCCHFPKKVGIPNDNYILNSQAPPPIHCGLSLILEEETEHIMETLTQTIIEWWIVLFKRNCIAGLSQVGYGLVGTISFKATTWMIRLSLISFSRRPVVCWECSIQWLDEAVNSLLQQ